MSLIYSYLNLKNYRNLAKIAYFPSGFYKFFIFLSSFLIFSHIISSYAFATDSIPQVENLFSLLDIVLSAVENSLFWLSAILNFILLGETWPNTDIKLVVPFLKLPLIVFWLTLSVVYFTIKYRFINITFFTHAFKIICRKETTEEKKSKGYITNLQATLVALSGTVGLGNIAGVAVAISLGGPGAIFWMVIVGFFSMTLRFIEITLAHKYRQEKNGYLIGGPFSYLKRGLENKYPIIAKILCNTYAIACILGLIGAGAFFQSNQIITLICSNFYKFQNSHENLSTLNFEHFKLICATVFALLFAIVMFGGLKRIVQVTETLTAIMAIVYIGFCIIIIFINKANLISAIELIFIDAFTGQAVAGGMLGVLIHGVRRAIFSNEAGLGFASIPHAIVRSNNSVEVGIVGLLEPFIDTVIICAISGLVIVITGVYVGSTIDTSGVLLTQQAFNNSLGTKIGSILPVLIFMFAFSTIIGYSFCITQAWSFLKSKKPNQVLVNLTLTVCVFIGGISKFSVILSLADALVLFISIPNIIGIFLLRNEIGFELKQYIFNIKAQKRLNKKIFNKYMSYFL